MDWFQLEAQKKKIKRKNKKHTRASPDRCTNTQVAGRLHKCECQPAHVSPAVWGAPNLRVFFSVLAKYFDVFYK